MYKTISASHCLGLDAADMLIEEEDDWLDEDADASREDDNDAVDAVTKLDGIETCDEDDTGDEEEGFVEVEVTNILDEMDELDETKVRVEIEELDKGGRIVDELEAVEAMEEFAQLEVYEDEPEAQTVLPKNTGSAKRSEDRMMNDWLELVWQEKIVKKT